MKKKGKHNRMHTRRLSHDFLLIPNHRTRRLSYGFLCIPNPLSLFVLVVVHRDTTNNCQTSLFKLCSVPSQPSPIKDQQTCRKLKAGAVQIMYCAKYSTAPDIMRSK